ncbi:hypothetical protein BCR34DRAFT_596377 [Clohesyomyces aquaticus]|uniref:DUF7820 domain-containing protein n=1 Tax=Clohesyomyces aquaticus TaxID=1231657 RepID=A0A1Y2A6I3_9PLEO|nr:hypothetical protein BCR34DRAFT_596377 [Clohesyomyces aquaticus]
MRLPRRSVRSITSLRLPSLRSSLSSNNERRECTRNTPADVEDGIELVPIERQNSPCAKQIAPCQEEKEVVPGSKLEFEISTKPLPSLPTSKWGRLSKRSRILTILAIQICIVLTIGLSLMSAKKRHTSFSPKQHSENATSSQSPNGGDTLTPLNFSAPIKRGTFALPFENVKQQSSACLAKNNQSAAWSCEPRRSIRLTLLPSSDSANITILYPESLNSTVSTYYGVQDPGVPMMNLSTTVLDPQYPDLGGAYYFKSQYTRYMLLGEDDILSALGRPTAFVLPKGTDVVSGDTVWTCKFDETSIEGYVYVLKNATNVGAKIVTSDPHNATNPIMVPWFPYMMKITEERLPDHGATAQCTKGRLLENGILAAQYDGQNQKIQLNLAQSTQDIGDAQKGDTINACRCQWLYQ